VSAAGRVLDDRYRLVGRLGAGGMAQVHRAVDEVLGRDVAVKLLRADLASDPTSRERLLREARSAASFSHPNAVAVYDVGEDGGMPFVVMELVEGRTLADRLRVGGALPVDEALAVVDDVLAALGAAHACGLVHRDVKPANVLLPDDGSGAKLADFGIAKVVRDAMAGLTATGQVLGTPRYLAPEQVAGEAATPRSDLYAAGVLCYELLAGRPPFDGEHAIAVALAHRDEEAVPLTELRPDVPPEVAAAVERAMRKDPAERPVDAEALRAALRAAPRTRAALAETAVLGAATTQVLDPVAAAPPPGGRRRRLVGVAAVALLGLAGTALALGGGEDADVAAAPTPAPTAPVDEALPQATAAQAEEPQPEPEPEPAQAPGPATPEDLLAALEADPDAFGKKGDGLRQKLRDLLEEKPKDQPKKAGELIKEAAKWAREGDLDPATAEQIAVLLAPMASSAPEEDEGKDKGRGNRGGPPADRGGGRGR
jgi:eukaryotic-like serine/threonine-protein kinase